MTIAFGSAEGRAVADLVVRIPPVAAASVNVMSSTSATTDAVLAPVPAQKPSQPAARRVVVAVASHVGGSAAAGSHERAWMVPPTARTRTRKSTPWVHVFGAVACCVYVYPATVEIVRAVLLTPTTIPSCGSRLPVSHQATTRTCTSPTRRNVKTRSKSAICVVYRADAPSTLE